MQRRGTWIPLALAIGASIVYVTTLTAREAELNRAYQMVTILVARVDLPERALLLEDLVRAKQVPRRYVPHDAFEVKVPSDVKMIKNLVTRIRLPKGSPIVRSALTSLSPQAGLALKVPPGYRGAVVPIGKELMPLIKPGDHIDIAVAFDALFENNNREKMTATLLQNLLVLGVGNNLGRGMMAGQHARKEEEERTRLLYGDQGAVTVAVNPKEFQYLALAREQGKLYISVRGIGDIEIHPIPVARWTKLLGS